MTAVEEEVEFLITVSCDEIFFHVSAETVDVENRLMEGDRAGVEPTSPHPPPTHAPVPLNPCEG